MGQYVFPQHIASLLYLLKFDNNFAKTDIKTSEKCYVCDKLLLKQTFVLQSTNCEHVCAKVILAHWFSSKRLPV